MNDEMKKRLLDYARSRIQERQEAFRIRGGNNVQVDGKVVSAISSPAVIQDDLIEETWQLVLWGGAVITQTPGGVSNISFPTEATRVIRPSGFISNTSFWGSIQLIDSIPLTTTAVLTLEAVGHNILPPTYGGAGTIDPGPVIVTLQERETISLNVLREFDMDVYPGGSSLAIASSTTDVFTDVRPVAVRRKR